MRLCRFGDGQLGLVAGGHVRDVTAVLDVLPTYRYPAPRHDALIAHLDELVARVGRLAAQAPAIRIEDATLLSPVANPGKIIAAPVNYQKHLDEVQGDAALHHHTAGHTLTIHSAGLFLKATSSLVGPGEGIEIRLPDRRTDHEVELAVVIGRTASRVAPGEALKYVAGYAVGLDVTIRGSEDRSFRKSADTYSVLGPWLVTADEIPNPGALDLEISVNGQPRQKSNTKYLILGVPELIALASSFYTLYPGDIIFTGTPEGVSPIEPGDRIVASVASIGTMSVAVRAAEGHAQQTASDAAASRG